MRSLIALVLVAGLAQAQVFQTQKPIIAFRMVQSDADGTPASISAVNENGRLIWSVPMGRCSAMSISPSSDWRYLAVLVGDRREEMALPALEGCQNTLYVLTGSDGRIVTVSKPLQPAYQWADEAWQNLRLVWDEDRLTVSGTLFSAPTHLQPVVIHSVVFPP